MEKKKLVLSAQLPSLETLITFVLDEARTQGMDAKKLNHLRLAAEELLVNIIRYAYPEQTGDIEVTVTPLAEGGIEVEIMDSGKPFDPLSLPEPDIQTPLEQRKIGGLGIFLVRRLMDSVRYERRGNQNVITFSKKN